MGHVDDGMLNALLDGELEAGEAAEVRAHLAGCAGCSARYEDARRFLDSAAELLGVLMPPATAPKPEARPQERAAGTRPPAPAGPAPEAEVPAAARAVGVAPLAPVGPAAPGGEPPRRVSKTKREVALDLDGATHKSPAIAPNVAMPGEAIPPPAAPPPPPGVLPISRTRSERVRRVPDWATMAWAASIVLAVGVGYLANEVRHRPASGSLLEVAAAPTTEERTATSAPAGTQARPPAPDPKTVAAPGAVALANRPAGARGAKPRRPSAAADATPLADAGLAAGNLGRDRSAELAAAGGVAAAPQVAGQPSAAPMDVAARAAGAASPAPAFRNTDVDAASARLGGQLRTIEGIVLESVKIGPGVLVPGAVATRDVVRLVYTDQRGARIHLDQQRVAVPTEAAQTPARAGAGQTPLGLAPGDTLVTTVPGGEARVRWLDRAGLWLSLTGNVPADSLRALVRRVR